MIGAIIRQICINDRILTIAMTSTELDFSLQDLSDYLVAEVAGFQPITTIQKFSVGQSNPTYKLSTSAGDFVLRRQPFGELLKSAHQVDREFRVMSSLPATPLPEMVHLCRDPEIIGSMFFVMSFIDGEQHIDPSFPSVKLELRKSYYHNAIDALAQIHSADLQATNLTDYGKGVNFFARQIGLWTKQYELSFTEVRPNMDHLAEWLPANLPEDDGTVTLIHGDYKFDNMLFAKSSPEIAAILDWELSTLGHPISDLAYFCMGLRLPKLEFMFGLADVDRHAQGLPSEAELVERYCEQRKIPAIDNWHFYLAFSFFRLASISQGVFYRSTQGNASSEHAVHAGKMTDILAQMGAQLTR